MTENQPNSLYQVLINHRGQYSLWSELSPVPEGWRVVKTGSKDCCLDCINQQWTNLRPTATPADVFD